MRSRTLWPKSWRLSGKRADPGPQAAILAGLESLLSPPILAFVLGAFARAVRSDLSLPRPAMQVASAYLLLAIGLKGGFAVGEAGAGDLPRSLAAALVVGALIPLVSFAVLRRGMRMDQANSGAIAAHYGSISIVTFTYAITYLEARGIPFEGSIYALAVILEIPGILVGLLLAKRGKGSLGVIAREMITGKSVILLGGGMAMGLLSGPAGQKELAPFFVDPFKGVLVFFMLDLGMQVVERIAGLKERALQLAVFGLSAPLVNGAMGMAAGAAAGLSLGGTILLAVLCASASYIAATAAVSHALPEANPALYLGASLGVTFPFNVLIGVPIIAEIAIRWLPR